MPHRYGDIGTNVRTAFRTEKRHLMQNCVSLFYGCVTNALLFKINIHIRFMQTKQCTWLYFGRDKLFLKHWSDRMGAHGRIDGFRC